VFEIGFDKETKEKMKGLQNVGRQVGRALAYFSRAIAAEVAEEVQRMGKVPGVDYNELEVAYFGKIGKFNVSALVLPDSFVTLTENDKAAVVVTVNPLTDSVFLRLMEQKSPWPVTMLPPNFDKTKDARLIVRRVSAEEVESQVVRLISDKDVYPLLVEWRLITDSGDKKSKISELMQRAVPDYEAQEDIAWKVLRYEFGLGGNPSAPHWRKSLKKSAIDLDEELLYGFWEIISGERREGIPRKNTQLMGEMGAIEEFQDYVTSRSAASKGDPQR